MRKMLQLGLLSLVILGLLNFASLALAQRGGGGPPGGGFGGGGFGGGGTTFLLQDENVKKELGLVPEQESKLRAISERSQTEMREMFTRGRDLSEDERRERFTSLREKSQREIDDVLLPQQRERLKQISVQSQLRRGNDALTSDTLAQELNLTDADKERVRKATEEAEAELRQKIEQLRLEAREKVIRVLSPTQQAKFKQLTGNPIEFAPTQFFRGGQGGTGGGGFQGRGGPGGGDRGGDRGGGTRLQRPADGD